jgi:hypothetical protein
MRLLGFFLIVPCLIVTTVCTTAPEESAAEQHRTGKPGDASPNSTAASERQTGVLNFPVYTAENEREILALQPGEWVPVKIDRPYIILRGSGIRLAEGDYFVQLLTDATGKATKFLLAKKRGTPVAQVDLNKARAKDGSFAAVLDFASEVEGLQQYAETKAYISSSGESSAVWVQLAGTRIERRGELMGWAGPSEKLQVHQ